MDLNTIGLFAAAWFVVSVITALALGGFIRQGNGARDEENAANSPSGAKVVSYLHRQRRKAALDAEPGATDLQRTAEPRRRAV